MKYTSKWLLGSLLLTLNFVTTFQSVTVAQSAQEQSTFVANLPKFMVLGVVYAPPGASSFVTYGNTQVVGSADSISTGYTNDTELVSQKSSGFSFLGFGKTTSTTTVNDFTSSKASSTSLAITSTTGNSISTMGPISSTLGVDHDNDVIYIMLNPAVMSQISYMTATNGSPMALGPATWDSLWTNGCDSTSANHPISIAQRLYGCDPNQYPFPDIIGIPVWCLKNPYYPGQGCSQWQQYVNRVWDVAYRGPADSTQTTAYPEDPRNPAHLTLQDFDDILKADPFIAPDDISSNVCHPAYGPNFDPNNSETQVVPVRRGPVVNAFVTSGGSGYNNQVPSVVFAAPTSGGGTTATGSAVLDSTGDSVISIALTNPGSGYTAPPLITIASPPNPASATVCAAAIAVGTSQSGCTATAVAYLPPNGPVDQIFVTDGGLGYSTAPTVSFSLNPGAEGSGATGTAILGPNGSVVSVQLTSPGSGYTGAPNVNFVGSSPTRAAKAVAYLVPSPTSCWNGTPGSINSRFQPYGTIAFPEPGPNGLPATYAGKFEYSKLQTQQVTSSDTHMSSTTTSTKSGFDLSVSAGVGFGNKNTPVNASINVTLAQIDLSTSNSNDTKTTYQNSNSVTGSEQYTGEADYSITGPQLTDNYTGPATYNVYMDNVYGTFAFYSPLTPKVQLGHIDVTSGFFTSPDPLTNPYPQLPTPGVAIPVFGATTVGQKVYAPITLINNSMYPMTMVFPAVTFSDPGYSLVENDPAHPDNCSNQYLLGQQPVPPTTGTLTFLGPLTYYCSAWIQFSPTSTDQQSVKSPTPAVNAAMIAAGTLNVSPYENILVTSHTQIYGTVSGTRGATLLPQACATTNTTSLPAGACFTQYNPDPYIYTFPNVSGVTSAAYGEEDFYFTSNYSAGVTNLVPTLTEFNSGSGDFLITSNTCNSLPTSVNYCTIHVEFRPNGISPLTGPYFAMLTVSGQETLPGTPVTSGPITVLATVAMTGTASPVLTMIASGDVMTQFGQFSSNQPYSGSAASIIDDDTSYSDGGDDFTHSDGLITVTNNSSNPVTGLQFYETTSDSRYLVHFSSGTCVNGMTLYPINSTGNNSCTAYYPYSAAALGYGADFNWSEVLTATGTTTALGTTASISVYFDGNVNTQQGCEPNDEGCLQSHTIFAPVNPSDASQTVPAGNLVKFVFNLAPPTGSASYPGSVSFVASGLPPGASVSFTPQSIAANGGGQTVTMTIQTIVPVGAVRHSRSGIEMASLLVFLILPLATVGRSRTIRRTLPRSLLLAMIVSMATIAGMTGCSAGGNASPPVTTAVGPKTYQITVTATMGKVQVATHVSLTLQ